MRFSQDFIDKVREANNVVEIIGQYTELKGSGHRLMGRCPFPDHSDKSPSFSVTEDNQLYFCYGCKKGGNVFTFLETFNGMSFPEAIEFLARRASIPLPEPDTPHRKSSGPTRDQKDILLKVNKTSAVYYYQQLKSLPSEHAVRAYIAKRGLSAETVEKFRLGYASDAWQGLVHHFHSRKIPIALGEQLGLFKPRKNPGRGEDTHFDLFRERLMFPIFSSAGDVIGFGGRTLGDGLPKYLNSSDSPVFHKGRVLYGLHETGKYIRAEDSAIVVEGYMDAIALYTAGIKNVVAILGTAFTPDHAKVLKRYTQNVTVLLDGDDAGIGGAERSLPILLAAGMMPKGFLLPEKMDPDDFIRTEGVDRLREETSRAPELFSLLLRKLWMRDYNGSASEKVRIVEEAAACLRTMENRQLQDLYILELSRQLDVDIPWVRKALAAAANLKARAPQPTPVTAATSGPGDAPNENAEPADEPERMIPVKAAPRDEAFVLSLLLHHEGLMRELVEAGLGDILPIFTSAGVREAIQWAAERYQKDADSFAALASALASRVDAPGVIAASVPLVTPGASAGMERKLMADYLSAIKKRYLKAQAKALTGQLREGASIEKLEEFMSIQRHRQALGNEQN